MEIFEAIEKSFEYADKQDILYKPSSFWNEATKNIFNQIKEFGIENFRSLNLPLSYFVPTYGSPGNSLNIEIEDNIKLLLKNLNCTDKQKSTIENYLRGYNHALSDYRVFKAADIITQKPFLNDFSESRFGNPKEQFNFDGKLFSRSSLNYILGLTLLKKHLNGEVINNILEIGGGFGSLGEVLNFSGIVNLKYIDIDIPPLSYIAWNYLNNINNKSECNNLETLLMDDDIEIMNLNKFSVFNNWQIEKLIGTIDLFVNFISFQEMEPEIVSNYLIHIKRLKSKWVLLRNLREGKQIKSISSKIGVIKPILKENYIEMLNDEYELIDSNIIPFGYKTVDNFHSELLIFKRKS